ncbi:SAM-dependent methyltransferase [Aliiglaciecola aliphaticivorans]
MPENNSTQKTGSIVCVGLGMILGSHIAPLSRQFVEQADVVFMSVTDPLTEAWVEKMNPNCHSLQRFYADGKDRRKSYAEMVDAIMAQVELGKKVVAAFYGHPGVFAWAPHKLIQLAKEKGYHGHMEPGISAEDCLYSDMGIDPGRNGAVHVEASQFMLYERKVDNTAYLILWQLGFVGDLSMSKYQTDSAYRLLLQQLLIEYFPAKHKVAIYESPTLPTETARIDWFFLDELSKVHVEHYSTLIIPPCEVKKIDLFMQHKMNQLSRNQ